MTNRLLFAFLPALLLACGDKAEEAAPSDDGAGDDGGGDDGGEDCVPTDEVCDGEDNDCDGDIDEDATDASTFFVDADGDGYGDDASTELACDLPSGMSDVGGDCDDNDASSYPDGLELCDGVDNDCDGAADGTSVPTDFATIQEAVNAAVEGELICLDAGEYTESVEIVGKTLRLGGAGPDEVRITAPVEAGLATEVGVEEELVTPVLIIEESDGAEVFGMSLGKVEVTTTNGLLLEDLVFDDAGCTKDDCKGAGLYVYDSTVDLVDLWVQDNAFEVSTSGDLEYHGLVYAEISDLSWVGGGIVGNSLDLQGSTIRGYGLLDLYESTLTASDVVVEGNDIDGYGTGSATVLNSYHQGFVYARASDMTLTDVWIRDNVVNALTERSGGSGATYAQSYGAILADGSAGTITWTGGGIAGNFSQSDAGSQTYAYASYFGNDAVVLQDVEITDNDLYARARDEDSWGVCSGFYSNEATIDFDRVDIRANQVNCDGDPTYNYGLLVHWNGATTYDNVVVAGNYLDSSGYTYAPISLNYQSATPTLSNVTIHDNSTFGEWVIAGALHAYGNGVDVVNASITENSARASNQDSGFSMSAVFSMESAWTYSFAYSNIEGNYSDWGAGAWIAGEEKMADIWGSTGVITEEPGYVDVTGTDPEVWDLHLASGSALVDAGDPGLSDEDGSTSDVGAYGGPNGAW